MTCIKDTYKFVEKHFIMGNKDFMIIHAIVERVSDNLRHAHAVVYNKQTGNIHEVSNSFKNKNIIIPFSLWLKIGKVSNIKQYTFNEFNELMIKTKIWDFYHLPNKKTIKNVNFS